MLYVESYKNRFDISENVIAINTTSRSDNWTRGLSPFLIEGGKLYGDYYAYNVENAWQASKVYALYDDNGQPADRYFKWAERIWNTKRAIRYPMGKGIKPLYSYWDGEKYDYVTARKKIYIPIYARGVIKTNAYHKLSEMYEKEKKDIYLIDFDGYNHIKLGMSIKDVINCPDKKMGHAFVIYALLTMKIGAGLI
jgi:hypothetical protein